jgi:hypothetical protein
VVHDEEYSDFLLFLPLVILSLVLRKLGGLSDVTASTPYALV